jgi:integrase
MALIETTKDGRPLYRVRWDYRRDPDTGKQTFQERRFRNKRQAVDFERQNKAGVTVVTERITVAQLATLWFAQHVDVNLELRTRSDYRTQYEQRIKPRLGNKRVANLTPAMISQWQDRMSGEGVGARTANKSLDALKAMIRWGRSKGYCANQLVDDTRRLKQPKPKAANPYTPAEVDRIANGCKHLRDATMIRVAAYSGLRWSELRAIQWNDIDWDAETIELTRSVDLDRSMKSTKSDKHRVVPVLEPGMRALREWREQGPNTVLVFSNRYGRPLANKEWWERVQKIREACGIPFDLHELRDTYASILIASGIGEAELTMWLGHESIQTTINRYGKLFAKRKATLKAKANAALAAGAF